jgi:hypothetical protein
VAEAVAEAVAMMGAEEGEGSVIELDPYLN